MKFRLQLWIPDTAGSAPTHVGGSNPEEKATVFAHNDSLRGVLKDDHFTRSKSTSPAQNLLQPLVIRPHTIERLLDPAFLFGDPDEENLFLMRDALSPEVDRLKNAYSACNLSIMTPLNISLSPLQIILGVFSVDSPRYVLDRSYRLLGLTFASFNVSEYSTY